jgi:hypothetical protein
MTELLTSSESAITHVPKETIFSNALQYLKKFPLLNYESIDSQLQVTRFEYASPIVSFKKTRIFYNFIIL